MTDHGTRSCYVKGCRLPECVAANTAYKAEWRSRPLASRPGVFESRALAWLPDPADDEDLAWYADPDCASCAGSGGTLASPCEVCIVAVWS
jgi:hypothetical protein